MSLSGRWFAVLLGLVVAVGVGLRLHHLDKRSLWADELFTLTMAKYYPFLPDDGRPFYRRTQVTQVDDGDTFLTAKAAEQSPPLNDLLEKATVNWLGATEVAARLPAVLAACSLVLWFAGFAWRHPDPYVRRVLRWSLLLLALHPTLVLYAKEGRAYSVGVSLLGMAGLLWMLRWRNGWRAWQPPGWLEIALFTLACFSHYNAALLVALLLSVDAVAATQKRSGRAWLRLLTLGAVFCVWLALNSHTILFTSGGGVAWGQMSGWDRVQAARHDMLAVLHPQWLSFAALVLLCLVIMRWRKGPALWPAHEAVQLWCLGGLTALYLMLAGGVAAKAGMAHPRFFVFILPFVAVMMGLVFAEVRKSWMVAGVAVLLVLLAKPSTRLADSINNEDWRGMTLSSVRSSDKDTLFLYPWIPNRNLYRVYLERYLGGDLRPRMVGISSSNDALQVCEQLKGRKSVEAVGHVTGKGVIDSVYAACGIQWPQRTREEFRNTFAEHWRAP